MSQMTLLVNGRTHTVDVDPATPRSGAAAARVFFGATVIYKDAAGQEHTVAIVGIDEVDLGRRHSSS